MWGNAGDLVFKDSLIYFLYSFGALIVHFSHILYPSFSNIKDSRNNNAESVCTECI